MESIGRHVVHAMRWQRHLSMLRFDWGRRCAAERHWQLFYQRDYRHRGLRRAQKVSLISAWQASLDRHIGPSILSFWPEAAGRLAEFAVWFWALVLGSIIQVLQRASERATDTWWVGLALHCKNYHYQRWETVTLNLASLTPYHGRAPLTTAWHDSARGFVRLAFSRQPQRQYNQRRRQKLLTNKTARHAAMYQQIIMLLCCAIAYVYAHPPSTTLSRHWMAATTSEWRH